MFFVGNQLSAGLLRIGKIVGLLEAIRLGRSIPWIIRADEFGARTIPQNQHAAR